MSFSPGKGSGGGAGWGGGGDAGSGSSVGKPAKVLVQACQLLVKVVPVFGGPVSVRLRFAPMAVVRLTGPCWCTGRGVRHVRPRGVLRVWPRWAVGLHGPAGMEGRIARGRHYSMSDASVV